MTGSSTQGMEKVYFLVLQNRYAYNKLTLSLRL
jgi:hypothetical protein